MQPTQQLSNLFTLDRVIRFPLTIASESLVANAIALLNQSQTDCVLIVEDWQLLGIFTERDVVRLAASGRDLSKLKLFEAIARPVITMTQSNSQDPFTALSLMRQHQIRHLPIVDKHERLVGLVTQTSLLRALASQAMSGDIEALRQPIVAPMTELKQEIESQQIEVILNESDAKFPAVFNSALDAISIVDDEGRFIYVNPSACKLFGLSKAELLDCTIANFVEPGLDFNELWQSFRQQKYLSGELRLHLHDGVVREVEYTATADFLPHHHLSIIRDISDRKRGEEALRQYERIVSATPDGVALVNRDYTYRLVNQTYLLNNNKCYEKIIGHTISELLGADGIEPRYVRNSATYLSRHKF